MENSDIIQLERQVNDLVGRYDRLKRDYDQLKKTASSLENERQILQEKNFLASQKIESIIKRLKDLEKEDE